MKRKENEKKKKSILVRIALLILGVYLVVLCFNLQMQLNEKQEEIDTLQAQISELTNLNEDLQDKIDNQDDYLEQQARENGYVKPNADVYVEIP